MNTKALLTSRSQPDISTTISQWMMSKHLCPQCSSVLLRHVRLGELYWRCSSCHQEMLIEKMRLEKTEVASAPEGIPQVRDPCILSRPQR